MNGAANGKEVYRCELVGIVVICALPKHEILSNKIVRKTIPF